MTGISDKQLEQLEQKDAIHGEGAVLPDLKPYFHLKNPDIGEYLGLTTKIETKGTVKDERDFTQDQIVAAIIKNFPNETLDSLIPIEVVKLGSVNGPIISLTIDTNNKQEGTTGICYQFIRKGYYSKDAYGVTAIYQYSMKPTNLEYPLSLQENQIIDPDTGQLVTYKTVVL